MRDKGRARIGTDSYIAGRGGSDEVRRSGTTFREPHYVVKQRRGGQKLEVALSSRAEQSVCLVGQGRHSDCTSVRVDQHFGRGSLAKRPGLLPGNS